MLAAWLALMVAIAALSPTAARAETPVELMPLKVERSDDGVYLSTIVLFELPPIVEDALHKGIAIHFVAEAEVTRYRWYWTDSKVISVSRHMRLAYQPLTRRWRLNIAPQPIGSTGIGLSLSQNFDSLAEALSAVQRISRWRLADADDVDAAVPLNVEFSFRLDTTQLPRPIQIGVAGQSDWSIAVGRTQRLVMEAAR